MEQDLGKTTIKSIIKKSSNPKLIEAAFNFAEEAYQEKNRTSGENYIHHGARVASMLQKMQMDDNTVAFGILHDAVDDMPESSRKIYLREIEKSFGKEISQLVEKISTISKIRYALSIGIKDKKTLSREKIENLRRMFLALSGDLRVVLVELISRLDGLNYLHYLSSDQQKLYALESLQIFVPIANRLGLSAVKRELEDVAFSYLFPDHYKWLKENLKEKYEEREKYLISIIPQLKKILKKEKVKVVDINYRAKSYWSTYQKLVKHEMNFNKIYDLLALRIITADIPNCYRALGAVHKYFQPISEEINDYIAKPKPNGYRSLHTAVFSKENKITEIQIRTEEMQKEAEYGIYAHWSYKEKIDLKKEGQKFEWINKIRREEFNKRDNFKIDFFTDQVFCFTPKGDVIILPAGATPVDFAYAVHSDIGNHCESAKISGKIVQLNHTLNNGDVVEITTNKKKLPSKDWLSFVKTSFAKSNIKKLTEQKSSFKIPLSDFFKKKIAEISERVKGKQKNKVLIKKDKPRHIYLAGQKGILIHIAKCCNPQPGDKVNAYIAPHRAAVLHRASCPNLEKIKDKFPNKIIEASWE